MQEATDRETTRLLDPGGEIIGDAPHGSLGLGVSGATIQLVVPVTGRHRAAPKRRGTKNSQKAMAHGRAFAAADQADEVWK